MKNDMSKLTNGRPQKEWHPTQDQIEFIKAKYATYYSVNHTLTKTRLAKLMGVSIPLFERACQRLKIKPREPQQHSKRDFSKHIRVAVPCKFNCPTFILVHPDKDPEEAKRRYMEKHKARLDRKPWQNPRG